MAFTPCLRRWFDSTPVHRAAGRSTKSRTRRRPPHATQTMPDQQSKPAFDHRVTYANTLKHWVLYTLDAIEAESHQYDEPSDEELNEARTFGTYPEHIYEYAAGDDSIVFKNHYEISSALSEMALLDDRDDRTAPVERRTDATEWDGPDVKYRYRLTDYGRNVLLDLGVPDQLPNRRADDYDRELGGVRPAHQPGWWQPEYDLFSDEWDIRDHDWTATDHDHVFYKDEAAAEFTERGYDAIGRKLTEIFDDVTFVLTIGPYRSHDLAYIIRDPWRRVVQIDIYSPMAYHRAPEEITQSFESLVRDLRKGLESVTESYVSPDATGETHAE